MGVLLSALYSCTVYCEFYCTIKFMHTPLRRTRCLRASVQLAEMDMMSVCYTELV